MAPSETKIDGPGERQIVYMDMKYISSTFMFLLPLKTTLFWIDF